MPAPDAITRAHGARPVPVNATAPPQWAPAAPSRAGDGGQTRLRPAQAAAVVPPVPADHTLAIQMARGPLQQWATAPVVGVEGGAGRTTVTRLLGRAFATIRTDKAAAVDAVPLWGGLTASLARADDHSTDDPARWTVHDLATCSWPPPIPVEQLLETHLAADGPVPTVTGASSQGPRWPDPAMTSEAIRRLSATVALTIVDTVADPAGPPVRSMLRTQRFTPVWVCTATRAGLWGVAEAIDICERLGAHDLTARSVIAVVGHRRHWSAQASSAEMQLRGHGLEVIRIPFSRTPITDRRCARAAIRLLAAVIARSG